MMGASSSPFVAILNAAGYRTYVTAGCGIVFELLRVFHVITLTQEQADAITGGVIMLAAIFLRLGIANTGNAQAQLLLNPTYGPITPPTSGGDPKP